VFGLMGFLTAHQKQQHVVVCKELRQIASSVASFLYVVIPGDDSLI
jgi:hypothetical protein